MTPEEHAMIKDLRDKVEAQGKIIEKMDHAFFQPPIGRPKAPTLFARIERMVWIGENGSFSVKWSVRIFLTLGGILATVSAFKGSFFK